jgi:pimeloyl-ACP methyl ester carboxylesterase
LPAGRTSFAALKQIKAGVLDVGYAEAGPANGPVVILLHGWPYDIHSFVDVAPLLAAKGYRAIVPYLRGYGTTRFLSSETVRNGQPSALAVDGIAPMDALKMGLSRCRVVSSRFQMNDVSGSNARSGAPCLEGLGPEPTLRCGCDEMATDVESVVDRSMCREEPLSRAG